VDKKLFLCLDNLHVGQKVVSWFSEGQKFMFLCCPLPLVCLVSETFYKSNTVQLELSCLIFHFSGSNTPYTKEIL